MAGGFKVTPTWLVTIVCCGLLIYVVVKKLDDISEVKIEGSGIAFRGSASPSDLLSPAQRERSRKVENRIEAEVREAPSQAPPRTDLSGAWITFDGASRWTVSLENGQLMFREQQLVAPGVVSAAGYGTFDGHTWSLQFESILGINGTASLVLHDDGTLRGQATTAVGVSFALALRRE